MISIQVPKVFVRQTPMYVPRPRYIIIHNANCLLEYNDPKTTIDTKKQQYQWTKYIHVNQLKLSDINYHFIVDKLNNDYEIFVGKPLHSYCIFEDIDDMYLESIHIAVMGDYNEDMANKRLYDVLAYRLINPLLYWFHLDKNKVKLHSEVSKEEINCPGEFFFKEVLMSSITRYTPAR